MLPLAGDSPAISSTEKVAAKWGILAAGREEGAETLFFCHDN
ncbi:hypothetical protein [Methylomusa anaerophila]|nr:hypothetical protein [Methylomusa anaerophila]